MNYDRLHKPVLVSETLDGLRVTPGGEYLDLTFGEGGHTEALLRAGAGRVVAFDRDEGTLARYRSAGEFRDDPRLRLIHSRFSHLGRYVSEPRFDGVLIDLGVSTRQLLTAERGFSFGDPGPLDMRMDPSSDAALSRRLESVSVEELAGVLRRNTDLKGAFGAARRILDAFHGGRLKSTADLAALFKGPPGSKTHPATVVFLALRMWVNDEMGEAEAVIPQAFASLKPGGRLAVITFHSTEDRLVKRAFKALAGMCVCDKPICVCPREKRAELVFRKPVPPSEAELRENPRARSAKLRCIEKLPAGA